MFSTLKSRLYLNSISLITIIVLLSNSLFSQTQTPQFLETQATITSIETKQSGRRTNVIAKVDYVTQTGDSLSSQLQLLGLPILGSFKKEGDMVTILYDSNNPYFIKSKGATFLESNGLYIFIALGIVVMGYRFIKRKKTA